MSGDSRNDDDESHAAIDPGAGAGGDAMKSMLDALRTVAREEDEGAAGIPAAAVPALSDDARERIVQAILRAQTPLALRRAAIVDGGSASPVASSGFSSIADARARRERGPRRSFLVAAASLTAVAAAGIIWMRPAADTLPLPRYGVTVEGGAKDVRGSAPETGDRDPTVAPMQRLRGDSALIVGLRPDTSVSGGVTARAFVAQGADVSEVHPLLRVAPSGSVQLQFRQSQFQSAAPMGSLHGPANLRIVVGRPRALQSIDPQVIVRESSGPGWRAVTVPLVFEADAE
jgi:hypothetical protein